MFIVKNLRKESEDGWTYLKTDFEVKDAENPFEEKTMWVAVEDKNADMLSDDVYDAFVLVPLYLGMYYHQDVHIEGEMSPRFYHNIIHYIMKIFDNFSDDTRPIDFTVDGEADKQNNLAILLDLYQSGRLKKLYLDGNNRISDFSAIKNLDWSDKKGF